MTLMKHMRPSDVIRKIHTFLILAHVSLIRTKIPFSRWLSYNWA